MGWTPGTPLSWASGFALYRSRPHCFACMPLLSCPACPDPTSPGWAGSSPRSQLRSRGLQHRLAPGSWSELRCQTLFLPNPGQRFCRVALGPQLPFLQGLQALTDPREHPYPPWLDGRLTSPACHGLSAPAALGAGDWQSPETRGGHVVSAGL